MLYGRKSMAEINGGEKSDRILAELRLLDQGKQIVDVEEAQVKVVVFSLSGSYYAFNGEDIREILPPTEISWIPGVPEFLSGLINVRGDVESVIDLRYFLNIVEPSPKKKLIVIAVKNGIRSGILIDDIIDVIDLPITAVKAPLATLDTGIRDFVSGVFDYKSINVTLLDVNNIFEKIKL